ncbi:ATP-binding protein, partial [Bacteroides fragilis]
MPFLSKIQQTGLFKEIEDNKGFQHIIDSGLILEFISEIWDIDNMGSTDPRYHTLRGDIQQHFLNNDDWDLNYLFSEILKLYGDAAHYRKFLETIVIYKYQEDKDFITIIVSIINEYLIGYGLSLKIVSMDESGSYIYAIRERSSPIDDSQILQNSIPFIVVKQPNGSSWKWTSHNIPNSFPTFVLVADNWDDFGAVTLFDLFYYPSQNNEKWRYIGKTKILNTDERNTEGNKYKVKSLMPDKFEILSEEYCSLGQSQEYYDNIKNLFADGGKSIFWALKDCAIFSFIEDKFEKHPRFYSLIRENEVERLLRQEKYIIDGIRMTSCEKFTYSFTPKYAQEPISIDLTFDISKIFSQRVVAIIGQNGVGKTQFITKLPMDLASKNLDVFSPQIPLYSKIIAVSNSLYDNFKTPDRTVGFNYIYCGLSNVASGKRTIISPEELQHRLIASGREINNKGRAESLKGILETILPSFIMIGLFLTDGDEIKLDLNKLLSINKTISSGESTLLYLFCSIISNIRFDSLLLFDEPETHLHPNAITELMSAVYKLLDEFQSYAIIVTHSPLIIREMKSEGVKIMTRLENVPVIRGISIESLGENISTLV